jgi:neutral ceramidase
MNRRRAFQFVAVLAALLSSLAAAQTRNPGGWKAGVAKIAITPSEPIWMAGFGFRNHPSEGVREPIYVKALALQDETGATSVLVTADLVDTHREIWDPVAERCEKQFGILRARLVCNESHDHSAPLVRRGKIPSIYPLDSAQAAVVERYTAGVIDKAVEAAGRAIQNLAPATLAFGQGFAGIAVNRRRVWMQRSLPGVVDQDVPVLSVRDASGGLVAIVVGYACHATALSDYQVSGDWPGYAQAEIEKAHPGAVAMFVQGCGADANALPRRTVELAQGYGRILAAAADEVLRSKMTPLTGAIHAAFERVDVPFKKPPSAEELRKTMESATGGDRQHAERLLKLLDHDGKLMDHYPYPVQVWQFGQALKIIFLGGEVVADYALRLKAQYGWGTTWVAGYSNDVFAYIPSLRVLKEGGYEGGGAMNQEDFPGPFAAAIEEVIAGKVHELVERTRSQE